MKPKIAKIVFDKDQLGGTNGRKIIDVETGKTLKVGVLIEPLREYARTLGYDVIHEGTLTK